MYDSHMDYFSDDVENYENYEYYEQESHPEPPPASFEQKLVCDYLSKNNNVMVDSVAGSGKTTCNIYIAKTNPEKKILLLTYNARLKLETKERVSKFGITNLEVFSYHSFGVKYYNNKCYTDYVMIDIVDNDVDPILEFNYDILILDESQDMTRLYYQFVHKIMRDNLNANLKICILGDKFQSIYDFNHSDMRFLIFAEALFQDWKRQTKVESWKYATLVQSFRVTDKIARFINNCVLGEDRIISYKESECLPHYIICDCFKTKIIMNEIEKYLTEYSYSDIFILAPSVKSDKTPARLLANALSNKGHPIFVPVSDEEKINSEVSEGKILFSTYHQAKGLERKVVIVYGFDESYMMYYCNSKSVDVCPNTIYVAITRASERLVLIHHFKNGCLPFLRSENLNKYCKITGKINFTESNVKKCGVPPISVTNLLDYLPVTVIKNCLNFLRIKNITPASTVISVNDTVQQPCGYENVSEITGVAVPSYIQYIVQGKMSQLDFLEKKKVHNTIDLNQIRDNPQKLLQLTTAYCCYTSGYHFKNNQIKTFDWVSQANLDACVERVKNFKIEEKSDKKSEEKTSKSYDIDLFADCFKNARFEEQLPNVTYESLDLSGVCDYVSDKYVFEFKFVNSLDARHVLQLAFYKFLIDFSGSYLYKAKTLRYILYNIKTNEAKEVIASTENLTQLMSYVIKSKRCNLTDFDDKNFKDVILSSVPWNKQKKDEESGKIVKKTSKKKST